MLEKKVKLVEKCSRYLKAKCADIKREIEAIEASAANETKSSMGDKYETGREMIMQERQKQLEQYEVVQKHLNQLESINVAKKYDQCRMGALVTTNHGDFFISVALGKIKEVDVETFFISPVAPISKAAEGKTQGEKFSFNGRDYFIREIC